jgi:hypothetical protein
MQIPRVIVLFGASSALEETVCLKARGSVRERRFGFDLAPLAAAYWRQMQEAEQRK